MDPLASSYPWQSAYVFAANNPIRLIDVLGLGPGDPPTTAYHSTTVEAGEAILREGFKAGESGRNYFMTDPSGSKAGAEVASAPVQLETAINTNGAKTINYKQWRGFFIEAKADMGLGDVKNADLTKGQLKQLNAIRNQKAVQFMNQAGGDAFIIEAQAGKSGQKFIVMSDEAIKANVTIKSVPKGQEALVRQMETVSARSASGGSPFSRSAAGSKLFRYGRMALRFTGEALLIEGTIYGLRQKHESTKQYVQRRSLNGLSPFKNWMLDTHTDVGLYYWYKYSLDLDK